MKNMVFNNWTFSRVLWLAIGIMIITEAILRKDLLTGIAGLVYTGMGVLNKTFCSLRGCHFSLKKAEEQAEDYNVKQIRK